AVEADHATVGLAGFELRVVVRRGLVLLGERIALLGHLDEARPGALAELGLATVRDELLERLEAAIAAEGRGVGEAEQNRAVRGVEVAVLRHEDQLLDRNRLVVLVTALRPRLGDAEPPALLEER